MKVSLYVKCHRLLKCHTALCLKISFERLQEIDFLNPEMKLWNYNAGQQALDFNREIIN